MNRGKLKWRCRRGMKELDVVFEHFLEHDYDTVEPAAQAAFAELLELPDPQLLDYLTGRSAPSDAVSADVIARLRTTH